MKTTVFAAALALVIGAPLVASATEGVPAATRTVMTSQEASPQQGGNIPTVGQPVRPRFVGPYQLHHGLLPNGLAPNPFTYG